MSRTVSTYESKFTSVTREFEEYRRKNDASGQQMQAEIERLNQALRQKLEENAQLDRTLGMLKQELESLKRKFIEAEQSWTMRYESEISRTSTSYEQNITTMRGNMGELERKVQEMSRRMGEDERKMQDMSRRIA